MSRTIGRWCVSLLRVERWRLSRLQLHNPEDYPEPDAFKPERFLRASAAGGVELDPAVRDPRDIAFGFGRRCVLPPF